MASQRKSSYYFTSKFASLRSVNSLGLRKPRCEADSISSNNVGAASSSKAGFFMLHAPIFGFAIPGSIAPGFATLGSAPA